MPIIDLLQRQLAFAVSDSATDKIAKLEASLGHLRLPLSETLPLVALLLSLPLPATYELPKSSPDAKREKTLEALLFWLLHQAERSPLVLLIEDLHWADASTLQLITLLLSHVPTSKLILILTFRTEYQPPWKTHSYVTHITLSRLSARACDAMVNYLVKDAGLSPELRKQLMERADGVPLFIEELLKAVTEFSTALRQRGSGGS